MEPGDEYVITHLMVATRFLQEHPDVIKQLLEGVVAANEFVNEKADDAKAIINDGIEALTGARMPNETMDKAWGNLVITLDPIASSLRKSAEDACRCRAAGARRPRGASTTSRS